jgi:hypothetical protein
MAENMVMAMALKIFLALRSEVRPKVQIGVNDLAYGPKLNDRETLTAAGATDN